MKKRFKDNRLNLKQVSEKLKIELGCLLFFFRKKFYNIESVNVKFHMKMLKKLPYIKVKN